MTKLLHKHFKKYSDLYIILLTGLSGFLVFIFLNRKLELLIAILGFGISIAFSLRQSRIENDKMFKELFIMYNDKYDTKFNKCLNQIDDEVSKNPEYKLTEKQKPLVIDYLNLCAEEYLWHTKGRIDIIAWNSWERGMKYYLNISAIKLHIQNEKKQIDSYYGIFEYLKL
ncbi:hypothetical protein GKZ90_0005885 [Flavobacterium sp. MC2016-06]|uniref:hypothetical protein n=1 Tax=Flavobacterium sp. MC2016-06 TaxID=2676308 RepID=UPI0012BAE2C6|nr:hypothetical protein [Flavobacterium sp. MC2016-06]MBU3857668.1 hypothetical protein [Flavobacterium sp. MC2016-06]